MELFLLRHLELFYWWLMVLVASFAASHAVLATAMVSRAGPSACARIGVVVILLLEGIKRLATASCPRSIVTRYSVVGSCLLCHCVRLIELADAEVALQLLSSSSEPTAMTRGKKAWVLKDMHLRHGSLSSSVKVRRSQQVTSSSKLLSD